MVTNKWLWGAGVLLVGGSLLGWTLAHRVSAEPWPPELHATIERVCNESYKAAADATTKKMDATIYCLCLTDTLAKSGKVAVATLQTVKSNDQFHTLFSEFLNGPDGAEAKLDCFDKANRH